MIGALTINGVELDLSEAIDVPITYNIADITQPEKRKGSSTKEIKLEGTANNRAFFSSAYNLSITDTIPDGIGFDFDPTLRLPAQYFQNGRRIFLGSANLVRTEITGDHIVFVVTLYSTIVNIFQQLGDLKVSELDWSDYEHTLNQANIQATWTAPVGSGFVYPLIDFGYTNNTTQYRTTDLVPYVYVAEVWEKAMERIGYTASSVFLNSAMFRKKTIGSSGGERVQLAPAQVAERQCNYTADGGYTESYGTPINIIDFTGVGLGLQLYYEFQERIPIGDGRYCTTTQVVDDLQQFDEPNLELVVAATGQYNLRMVSGATVNYGWAGGTPTLTLAQFTVQFTLKRNGSVIVTRQRLVTDNGTGGSDSLIFTIDQSLSLSAGDILTMEYTVVSGQNALRFDVASIADAPTSYDVTFDLNNVFEFDLTSIQGEVQDGDTVFLPAYLPDIKVTDVLKGTITMYNLYVDEPNELKEVGIEPLDSFYRPTNEAAVWTDKLDRSKTRTITPSVNKVAGKDYRFRFAEDRDWYKQQHYDLYDEDYGDYTLPVASPFAKGDKVFQVPFAQSIPVGLLNSNIVIPRILSFDQATGTTKPYKGKARVFFYNGLRASDNWELLDSSGNNPITLTSYPLVHHLDDLDNPTFDMNFGVPSNLWYAGTSYTTANLFTVYHEVFIRELTGRDGKIYDGYFKLNEFDLQEGFLRRLVNIDGDVFRINSVMDYNANKTDTTKVSLTRVLEGRSRIRFVYGDNQLGFALGPVGENGGGGAVGGNQRSASVNEDATIEYGVYIVDTSARDVTITLTDDYPVGQVFTFKKTSDAGALTITSRLKRQIDDTDSYTIYTKNNSRRIYWDGAQYRII